MTESSALTDTPLRDLVAHIPDDVLVAALLAMPQSSAPAVLHAAREIGSRPVVALVGQIAGERSADAKLRLRAIWLLKEACDPAAWPALSTILTDKTAPEEVLGSTLDAIERMVFGRVVSESDVRSVDGCLPATAALSLREKWLRILGTLGGAWAREQLANIAREDALACDAALRELVQMRDPDADRLVREIAAVRGGAPVLDELDGARSIEAVRELLERHEPATPELVGQLVRTRKFAMLEKLVDAGLLPDSATTEIRALVPGPEMTSSQRKFLRRIQDRLVPRP